MNRFKNLATLVAFSLLILALPAVASAQWRNDRDDDRNNNYGYGNNNRNLKATIKNLKNRSKRFEKTLERALDNDYNYRNNRNNRNDYLEDLAKDFRRAVNRLDDNFDNRRNNNNSEEVRRVLQIGSQLDRALSRARLGYDVQSEWNWIRQDLRVLADAYNYNDRNNRNNRRNNRNYDWRDIFPF